MSATKLLPIATLRRALALANERIERLHRLIGLAFELDPTDRETIETLSIRLAIHTMMRRDLQAELTRRGEEI